MSDTRWRSDPTWRLAWAHPNVENPTATPPPDAELSDTMWATLYVDDRAIVIWERDAPLPTDRDLQRASRARNRQ